MPNVIDAEPMHAMARKAAEALKNKTIAARFQKLAFDRLLREPRNFRPALASELEAGPLWARAVHARGDVVCVFRPPANTPIRLRTVARRLADTCAVAEGAIVGEPGADAPVLAARRFLAKFDRVNFDTAARKALAFSRIHEQLQADRDAAELCRPQYIPASEGGVWGRIVSVAGLRQVGREFHNCLASSTRSNSYVAMLRRGAAQFWVLRDTDGAGLILAMATTGKDSVLTEIKGPRNVAVNRAHPDLCLLAAKLGLRARAPAPADTVLRVCIDDFMGERAHLSLLTLLEPTARRVRRRTSS